MTISYDTTRVGLPDSDDPEVLDCLEDNGYPRNPSLVEAVYQAGPGEDRYTTRINIDLRGTA